MKTYDKALLTTKLSKAPIMSLLSC